jgi:predicted metalloprotease with PDZ domain
MIMIRSAIAASSLVLAVSLQAQQPGTAATTPPATTGTIVYDIRFPNAVQREADVTIRFTRVGTAPLRVRMSRSSPGRYALHEFAKNVYAVKAVDEADRPLRIDRVSPHEWSVSGHKGTVVFSYTLFADRADGTYAGIDATRAHLNMPATFAWAPGLEARPIQVTFHTFKPDWRIATQLEPTSDTRTFRAPNLPYFLDSPTHLGALDMREWKVSVGPAGEQTIRLAVNHTGTADDVTKFTELTKRVVNEMAGVYGELPDFDYGTYTFIACYRPNCAGDGMEHRNSTSLTSGASIGNATMQLLGTVSHEFFHAWNVERIRPKSLEPFDFTEANMSGELWLAEGFTNYYGPLVIARAGILTPTEYAPRLSNAVNTLTNSPARRFTGAMGMSQQAPFVDAATSVDPHNRVNTFISYYTYGEGLGLALDLTLRARTPAVTLDDFMREMWRRHGKPQTPALAPAKPYTMADVEAALAAVTKDAAFAKDWFARFVVGSALPDYPALLARAGFLARPAAPDEGWVGDPFISAFEGRVVVAGPTGMGTPLYEAGLAAGDRIISVSGNTVATDVEYRDAVRKLKPGSRVRLSWVGREGPMSAEVTVRANPRVEVVTCEAAGRTPTAEQLAFRNAWLASRQ